MIYVLENTEEIKDPTIPSDEIITDGAISEDITSEDITSEDATSEDITSEGGESTETTSTEEENTNSTTSTEVSKEWPKGGSESFTNHALPSLVLGMLGIFLVLGLIAIATSLLNKLFPGKKQ